MSKVKEFFSSFSREAYSHEVAGITLHFYEIPYSGLAKLKKPITQLSQSLSVLMHNFDTEMGHHRTVNGKTGLDELTIMPKNVELSRQHSHAKSESISRIIDAFLNKDNLKDISWLVLMSMSDTFPNPSKADADEFSEQVTLPEMVEFCIGAAKANARLFDPFKEEAAKVAERLKERILGNQSPEAAEEAEQAENDYCAEGTEEDPREEAQPMSLVSEDS